MLLGWCGYYFIITCAHPLPESYPISNSTFYELQVRGNIAGVVFHLLFNGGGGGGGEL